MRAVSFLPSATEIVFALGLSDSLVAVTDKCDYPPEAKTKPVVVSSALQTDQMSSAEIDAAVREHLDKGKSLYRVNLALLQSLRPEIIIAQALCDVCAAANHEVTEALKVVPDAQVIWLNPSTLEDVLDDIVRIAEALGQPQRGEQLRAMLQQRIERVRCLAQQAIDRPRIWVAEWIDPPFCCGHWVPQMVAYAGGLEGIGQIGRHSRRIAWEEVLAWSPEVIVLAPCGYRIEQTLRDLPSLVARPGWKELPAVRHGRVYIADGDFFACPGPRLVDGLEMLFALLHPHLAPPEWQRKATQHTLVVNNLLSAT